MSAAGELRSPYQGLVPYAEEDAPFFFGREAERDIVVANLLASRLTLLYGPSGVGKTSLLHAGVVHHLRSLVRANIAGRETPEFAVVVFSSWRDDPVEGLISEIRAATAQLLGQADGEPSPQPSRLDQTIEDATKRLEGEILIVLDQFEEYFLYHDQQDGQGSFAQELSRAVNRWDLRVSFLIAIREDALAKLDRFKGLIPNLFDNYLRTEHLDFAAARMAIECPIEQYNRQLSPSSQSIQIEPDLVDEVLRQVRIGEVTRVLAGSGVNPTSTEVRVEAPYLQLVMSRLWDEEMQAGSHQLRLDTLERLGGAERIIRTHLDDAMSAFAADEQDIAAKAFRYLVTPSGGKVAHTARDLADYSDVQEAELEPVLEKLSRSETRILRPVPPSFGQSGATRYEIFHDVLAPAILDWRLRRHLRTQELERMERIARKRRRLMIRIVIAVAVVLTGLTTANLVINQQRARLVAVQQGVVSALKKGTFGVLTGHTGSVYFVTFSPDGRALASGSYDDTVRLWNLGQPGAAPTVLKGHEGAVSSVAFSPDGRTLASGSWDNTVRLWDLGHPDADPTVLKGHENSVSSVAFSPDGRTLASGSWDNTVRLWDLGHPGADPTVLKGHESAVSSVAFSPDGRTLASGSSDDTVRLWDLGHPGADPTVLKGHESFVFAVAFSPDGTLIATGDADYTARVAVLPARASLRSPSP